MPTTEVRVYRDANGEVPLQEWLNDLEARHRRAYVKCLARILELAENGRQMRRPNADYLRDGIYELRVRVGRVNYRILYFFSGKDVVALSHGLTKEREVPTEEFETAISRMKLVKRDPKTYTADFELH
jgi:phage-related protein